MRTTPALLALFLSAALAAAEAPTLTRKAVVAWEKDPYAVRYEMEITRDGVDFARPTIDAKTTEWTERLDPALYRYRIRSIDKLDRAGKWSSWKSLEVKPAPPSALEPKNGTRYWQGGASAALGWKPVAGAKAYEVAVLRDRVPVIREVVSGTHYELPDLPAGKYVWQVTGLLSENDRSPASAPDLASQAKETFNFSVEKELPRKVAQLSIGNQAANFAYMGESPSLNSTAAVSAFQITTTIEARIGIGSPDFLLVGLEHMSMDIGGSGGNSFGALRLGLGKLLSPAQSDDPWSVTGSLAAAFRDYLERNTVYGFGIGSQRRDISSYGLEAEVIVRRHFSQKLSLGGTFRYYLPVGLLYAASIAVVGGIPVGPMINWGGTLAGGATWLNAYLGLDATYYVSPNLGIMALIAFESRGLSYRRNPALNPERINIVSAHTGVRLILGF